MPEPRTGSWGSGPVGPRSGQVMPPLMGDQFGGIPDEQGRHTETLERAALRRPPGAGPGAAPPGEGIYRTRRPIVAVPMAVVAVLLAIPTLRVLLSSAFGPVIVPSGVIASVLALIGLPLLAMGLYALMTGAARVPEPSWVRLWLRPPLAYLVIGLVCLLAAGLAAG